MKHIPAGILLVRPDRYVAAFLPAETFEAGVRAVNELIARTWK
jgi:hypothetical protein